MCAEAGWAYELVPLQSGPGLHFGGGRVHTVAALGSSFVGGRHADQIRLLLDSYRVTAIGHFTRAVGELLTSSRPIYTSSHDLISILLFVARALGVELPHRLIILDASDQGPYGINTAAYQYPTLLRSAVVATDARDYVAVRSRFLRLGVTEHESLFVSPGHVGQSLMPEGPVLGLDTYAEYTSAIASQNAAWAEGLLLGDPMLILSAVPRAAELRLAPLYGRPQVHAIDAVAPSPRWSINGAWGRQFDDRDFAALGRRSIPFQLIDVGPPFHATAAARRLTTGVPQQVKRDPRNLGECSTQGGEADPVSDCQLRAWAQEGRVLTSLLYWCGMVREVEAVERVADLVAMTGLHAGIALTATAASHLPIALSPMLRSCEDAGGRLEVLLASHGDGILFEHGLGGPALSAHLGRMRRQLQSLTGESVRGWWPLLDGELHEVARYPKLREGRVVPPRHFSGRADEDRPTLEARIMRLMYGARVMQARPFEWVRPGPPTNELLEAVGAAGLDYVVSKSSVPPVTGNFKVPTVIPATAEWGGWTPFRTVATARQFSRLERQISRGRGCVMVPTVDTALWLQSGEAWRSGPEMLSLAQLVVAGGRTGRLINVAPEVAARYLAILHHSSDRA